MSDDFSTSFRDLLSRDVVAASRALLGVDLVGFGRRARIVETEAYRDDDPGCHAFRGKTRRNATMFERPGLAYVYFTYGNHWMLNVVAHPPGRGCAVLIRAARPLEGEALMQQNRPKAKRPQDLLSGPGKLAAAFGIHALHDGLDLLDSASPLRLEEGEEVADILAGPRIGLAIGKGDQTPWRFIDANHIAWASRPLPPRAT
ncbi:MAG: DNA-3-methyladenine glycosylase [Fimbriimonas sp.]